jgi:hypothetical protein
MIYINIESKKERNEHIKKAFSNVFGTIIRSEGVLQDNKEVQKLLNVMKDVDPNILAVTMSHLNAIKLAKKKTIMDLKNPLIQHAVIMEDDADNILMPFWQRPLDEIVKTFPTGWEAVQLAFTKAEKEIGRKKYAKPLYSRFRYLRKPSAVIGAEWGAIAYNISKAGMDKVLSTNLIKLHHRCYMMTADDCLLGFNPNPFFAHRKKTFNYKNQFVLHPPIFTFKTTVEATHRIKLDKQIQSEVAIAEVCGTFYENIFILYITGEKTITQNSIKTQH